jgi:trans-aconitate 2-methyltransferase
MHPEYPFDGKKYERASLCQREWGIELVEKLQLNGNEVILDLGCGNGVITRALAERVPQGRVVGVDNTPSMLDAARAHKTANMTLKLLDITEITFAAEFDVVFSNAALHWVLDHKKLLRMIYNAVKPGGFVRAQFGAAGNIVNLSEVLREVMRLPAYVPYFKTFRWPWYMPRVEEYEALLSRTYFRRYWVWGENKDRYFSDEESLIRMVEEMGLVPSIAVLPEDLKQLFRDTVINKL